MRSYSDELENNNNPSFGESEASKTFCEARLRVDRKKLEEMLQFRGSENNNDFETADGFFQRIMNETGTQIFWPSQLKIGARSKKDPNIKISGHQEAVHIAREKIIEVLYTKSNKVTMKIDVSYTDHSHVIGKCGKNVKHIMEETGCHIHFPDSNRSGLVEKSNQVSITGEPVGVEKARTMIRNLLPVVIYFDVPLGSYFQPILDPTSQELQFIQSKFMFTISFRNKTKDGSVTVQVRCSQEHFRLQREGIQFLMRSYLMRSKVEVPVTMYMEILPPHQSYLLEREFRNIEYIKQMTGVEITFPLPGIIDSKKTTVMILGSIENVLWAWKELMKCLPVMVIFDIREGQDVNKDIYDELAKMQKYNCIIKEKPKFNTKTLIFKGVERDAEFLLNLRQQLLKLKPLNFPSDNEAINLASALLSYPDDICLRSSCLKSIYGAVQPVTLQDLMNSLSNTAGTSFSVFPSSSRTTDVFSSVSAMDTNPYPSSSIRNFSLEGNNTYCKPQSSFFNVGSSCNYSSSPNDHLSNLCTHQIPNNVYGFGQSKLTQTRGLITPINGHNSYMEWPPIAETSNSSLGLSPPNGYSYLDKNEYPIDENYSIRGSVKKDVGSVGCERKNSLNFQASADYGHRKVMATKAMKRNMSGECYQTPSDEWAGHLFSNSMPEPSLRYCQSVLHHRSDEDVTGSDSSQEDWAFNRHQDSNKADLLKRNFLCSSNVDNAFSHSNYFESILPKPESLADLETDDLAQLLCKNGLSEYVNRFNQQEIDLPAFLTMTDQDLHGLGIRYVVRRKMTSIISEVNRQQCCEFSPFL